MSSCYVVKTATRLAFFYRAESNIILRTLEHSHLSPETCLMRNSGRHFNVTLTTDGVHIFCQDESGGLWLLTEREGKWNRRALNPNAAENNPEAEDQSNGTPMRDCLITPMISGKRLSIVYNSVSADGNSHYLVMQQMNEYGTWNPASRIDKYQPLGHLLYETQATSAEHMLLFYQTRTNENQLGYREVTPVRYGPYQRFHNASGVVSDTAYLTTGNAVHVLYIVRTLFSCQLLYRRRLDNEFSVPILLWEAPRIDQCLLSFVYDNLYATCMIGGQLHRAISENRGESFSRMTLYKSKFCYDPVKAVYLSTSPMSENDLYIRQVYVDRYAPWDTQMIPDLYGAFYSTTEPEPAEAPPAPRDVLRDMEERLVLAEKQLEDRDRQIMNLMLKMKTGS